MLGRKQKFEGKKTKWEKRRVVRDAVRRQQHTQTGEPKKPLAQPLRIADPQERNAAFSNGKMIFYDDNERIELPLIREGQNGTESLQGLYKIGHEIVTLRLSINALGNKYLFLYPLEIERGGHKEVRELLQSISFFSAYSSLGHVLVEHSIRGHGLALKGASKGERNVRAKNYGSHYFRSLERFMPIYEKLGYANWLTFEGDLWDKQLMIKRGKRVPQDNLDNFHVIEAIDPKTGKARLFRFPIRPSATA